MTLVESSMASEDFTSKLRPHPDAGGSLVLTSERQQSHINVEALSKHLFGNNYFERQQRILNIVRNEKIFSKANQANLSRPDRYKLGLTRGKRMRQLMDVHDWNDDDLLTAEYLVDDIQPFHLHVALSVETSAYTKPKNPSSIYSSLKRVSIAECLN